MVLQALGRVTKFAPLSPLCLQQTVQSRARIIFRRFFLTISLVVVQALQFNDRVSLARTRLRCVRMQAAAIHMQVLQPVVSAECTSA